MFDQNNKGKIAMINVVRKTLGAALMRRGYSINSTNEKEL